MIEYEHTILKYAGKNVDPSDNWLAGNWLADNWLVTYWRGRATGRQLFMKMLFQYCTKMHYMYNVDKET